VGWPARAGPLIFPPRGARDRVDTPTTLVQRLVLFDIDGTLLSAGGAAARAFRRALVEVFGTAGPVDGHSFAGKTDPQIAFELLLAAGLGRAEVEARLPDLWEAYLRDLPGELAATPITVLPGVVDLLERLGREDGGVATGLLTGNLEAGARMKLDAAGIGFARFALGAYGSDHAERSRLPEVAVRRAERRYDHRFEGKRIVVIGDTPHDISCGEALGVRTIAVATGSYEPSELAECSPDHLFPTLEHIDAVWSAIFDD
jgi:phosphoglycolate phosphatase